MGAMIGLIAVCTIIYLIVITVMSCIAYSEGKWDSQRTHGTYNNDFWMPMAYFYNRAYTQYEGTSQLQTIEDKNRERFGRK